MAGEFILNFVRFLLLGIQILVIARVLVSFVDPRGTNSISAFIIQTSEPLLAPIRRLLPRTGMFDFSPLIVILIVGVILRALP